MTDYTPEIPTKKCTGACGRTLPATPEFFHKQKRGKYGLKSCCRDCSKQKSHDYYSREDVKKHKREYDLIKAEETMQGIYE